MHRLFFCVRFQTPEELDDSDFETEDFDSRSRTSVQTEDDQLIAGQSARVRFLMRKRFQDDRRDSGGTGSLTDALKLSTTCDVCFNVMKFQRVLTKLVASDASGVSLETMRLFWHSYARHVKCVVRPAP